jgi:hypothetical protein
MGWLCSLIVVVTIVTVVGHLLWVLAAAILRGLFGDQTAHQRVPTARPFTRCPACQANADPRDQECVLCGFQFGTRLVRQLARVRAAEAEVRELAGAGDIEVEIAESVVGQLERRALLLQGLPADGMNAAPESTQNPVALPEALPVPAPERLRIPEPVAGPPVPASGESAIAGSVTLDIPSPSPTLEPPSLPPVRRGSVLAAFMEERNIFWGELVGGLLIVGCSIALVVTLWNRIETIPYFPFQEVSKPALSTNALTRLWTTLKPLGITLLSSNLVSTSRQLVKADGTPSPPISPWHTACQWKNRAGRHFTFRVKSSPSGRVEQSRILTSRVTSTRTSGERPDLTEPTARKP